MHPETHLALHHTRAAELHASAAAHRLATSAAGHPRALRARLGWTLVEVGLRLATPEPAALAPSS
ncbi:hypothetical protein [Streptomyces griseoruber]|uniref:Uncharacterized protein n=1 Tax=Streptomyces griseoruber TaxID=1943 RepID=A0A101SYT5_9ACTN|nr:hypothetical protein [Streptomyces griseoruber]KUN82612.1 hypothetical protein AQJ64_19000 [Streptomyces griseoruber]